MAVTVPTALQNLTLAYDQMCQQLADLTRNPKPSYSENGRSVSWGEHFRNLTDQLKVIREQMIKAAGPIDVYG